VTQIAEDFPSLNNYLATRSYLTGYAPTSDDASCFAQVKSTPDQKQFLNVARWYKHIASFTEAERKAWAAGSGSVTVTAAKTPVKQSPAKEQPKATPPAKKEEEEEDEDDLFKSDEEADAIHEAALKAKVEAARAGKPQKEKPKQRSLIVLEIKPNEMETDLQKMAKEIKENITHPGIQNCSQEHKLLPVAYGIMKLAISVVVWDDDIDTETIEDLIMAMFPDDIQSIDVAAMSKV